MIVLTLERIEELRTPAGGFNRESMEIIGIWPLFSGWKERLEPAAARSQSRRSNNESLLTSD